MLLELLTISYYAFHFAFCVYMYVQLRLNEKLKNPGDLLRISFLHTSSLLIVLSLLNQSYFGHVQTTQLPWDPDKNYKVIDSMTSKQKYKIKIKHIFEFRVLASFERMFNFYWFIVLFMKSQSHWKMVINSRALAGIHHARHVDRQLPFLMGLEKWEDRFKKSWKWWVARHQSLKSV